MTNTIVFEGSDEVIVVSAAKVNRAITDWFLNGGRSLDDYNIYLTDSDAGFQISTGVKFNDDEMKDFDVTELMPHDLREKLIGADLLTDES